jgi:hypothetical protein
MAYADHTPLRMLPENRLTDLRWNDLGHTKLVILPSPQGLTEGAWQRLLGYVAQGGTLLVTGPVDRDEHWQPVDRMTPLGVQATEIPLVVRGSALTMPGGMSFGLEFPANVQQSETLTQRFADGKTVAVFPHGSGKILWTADPVEFADGYDATAALYRWALEQAGVKAVLQEKEPLSPDVLAFPTVLDDGVLYSFSNESDWTQRLNFVDAATGAHVQFTMEPQRGAALLLDRKGKVLASYGGAGLGPAVPAGKTSRHRSVHGPRS